LGPAPAARTGEGAVLDGAGTAARAPEAGRAEGEASRADVGLQLLGDLAPKSVGWTYPLADEARRCFAGHASGALGGPVSRQLFGLVLRGTRWLQPRGRWGPLPLRTAWMTRAPCTCAYGYGGAQVRPTTFPPWMRDVMTACMPLCGLDAEAAWPNSCNLNLYNDGQHSVGWHADNEALFQGKARDCRIISLSLGETRLFEIKCKGGGTQKLQLADGDLCTMEGLTQKHYQHRVPKEFGRRVGKRINLTWRWVVEHAADCGSAAPAPASAVAAAVPESSVAASALPLRGG